MKIKAVTRVKFLEQHREHVQLHRSANYCSRVYTLNLWSVWKHLKNIEGLHSEVIHNLIIVGFQAELYTLTYIGANEERHTHKASINHSGIESCIRQGAQWQMPSSIKPATSVSSLGPLQYFSNLFHRFNSRANRELSSSSLSLRACAVVHLRGTLLHTSDKSFPSRRIWGHGIQQSPDLLTFPSPTAVASKLFWPCTQPILC